MEIDFGTIADKISYDKYEDIDSKIRDDLGLDQAMDFISNKIAPQVNTRLLNVAYLPYLLSGVDFASNQVKIYQQNNKIKDRAQLRRRFLFWLDLFEFCLAWTFKENNEKSFIGMQKNQFEKNIFLEFLNNLANTDLKKDLSFRGKFLTSRLSYAFDRHKYTMQMLGLVEPMQGTHSVYQVSNVDCLKDSPLYKTMRYLNYELSPNEVVKSFYKAYFEKNKKNITLKNKKFGRKLWDDILFDEVTLKQFLPEYLPAIAMRDISYDKIIANTIELKKKIETSKGEIFSRELISRDEYKKLLGKIDFSAKKLDPNVDLFLALLRILNYFYYTPRQMLNEINRMIKNDNYATLDKVKNRLIKTYEWQEKSRDFNDGKMTKFLGKIAEIDDTFGSVLDFLKSFYKKENQHDPLNLIKVLGERVSRVKGLGGQVYSVSNNQISINDQEYREKFKIATTIEPYYSRLGILKMIYRQCHE